MKILILLIIILVSFSLPTFAAVSTNVEQTHLEKKKKFFKEKGNPSEEQRIPYVIGMSSAITAGGICMVIFSTVPVFFLTLFIFGLLFLSMGLTFLIIGIVQQIEKINSKMKSRPIRFELIFGE